MNPSSSLLEADMQAGHTGWTISTFGAVGSVFIYHTERFDADTIEYWLSQVSSFLGIETGSTNRK